MQNINTSLAECPKINIQPTVILLQPYLNLTEKHFLDYILLWEKYANSFNVDKDEKESLKGVHRDTYFAIVHLVKHTIDKNNRQLAECGLNSINPDEWYSIRTNRAILGKRIARSGTTVWRVLMRLENAGIIRKIWHGTKRNFEILINPQLLLIFDYSQPNYLPKSKNLITENSAFQTGLRSFCTDVSCISQEHLNNKIMAVENSTDKNISEYGVSDKSLHETNRNIDRNTPNKFKKSQFIVETISGTPPHVAPAPPENKLRNYIAMTALQFYQYLIFNLFSTHNIYLGERNAAIAYIENYYFGNAKSELDCDRWYKQAIWRVDSAKRWIERNHFDMSNIYPCHYLDMNNPKGFAATKKWFTKSNENAKRKQIAKLTNDKRLSDKEKLTRIIRQFAQKPNLHSFTTCQQYVQNNIPHLMNEFLSTIKPN